MEFYVKISFISTFSFFLVFKHDLIRCVSQLQTQQVMASQIRSHRIFNTDLLYSCAHFIVENDEKSSYSRGF